VTLSTLLRGSVYERLKWTFKLYDLNGDGCISRGELTEVVQAVHELMGKRIAEDDRKTREQVSLIIAFIPRCLLIIFQFPLCRRPFIQVDRVFKKLDLNQDGVITIEEFLEACLKDELITKSLEMFDKGYQL
jgi:Ca2+-binding EF-hand superfamily protein